MFLLLGTFLLALGLIIILNVMLFNKIPKIISYSIIYITSGLLFLTVTVHGIWLGLTILILGTLWIKYFVKLNRVE